jgi:hypothetical protein
MSVVAAVTTTTLQAIHAQAQAIQAAQAQAIQAIRLVCPGAPRKSRPQVARFNVPIHEDGDPQGQHAMDVDQENGVPVPNVIRRLF